MNRIIRASLFSSLACLSSLAMAEGHLSASLTTSSQSPGTHVVLRLTNDGDETMALLKYLLPDHLLTGGRLASNFYLITDETSGHVDKVDFTGFWLQLANATSQDFIVLPPHVSVEGEYDLSTDYDVKPGATYKVSFNADLSARPTEPSGDKSRTDLVFSSQTQVTSNEVIVHMPSEIKRAVTSTIPTSASDFTEDQRESLRLAVLHASAWYSSIARSRYLDGEPPLYFRPNAYSVNGSNYNWWFGKYSDTDDSEYFIKGTIKAIDARLRGQSAGTPKHRLVFVNGGPNCVGNTPASAHTGSVKTDGTYEIVVCPYFFELPFKPGGNSTASQIGSVLHEISHFSDLPTDNDPWLIETSDVSYISYTPSGAHDLATNDRAKAVTNASNYEFYMTMPK